MSTKFVCVHCGHKLKAQPEAAGKSCRCPQCGQVMPIPGSDAKPAEPVVAKRRRWVLGAGLVAGLLLVAGAAVLIYALRAPDVAQALNDLKGDEPNARAKALVWLAEAVPQDGSRAPVTAALEPILLQGDVRKQLDPDLVLRVYLHWADQNNVPTLIRLVDHPTVPDWQTAKTERVMEALGQLRDRRAATVLAQKLPDPDLHDDAVAALKVLGPDAADAVLPYRFDGDPATRQRADDVLTALDTPVAALEGEAIRRLQSNDPEARENAAAWLADNAPDVDDTHRAMVAKLLAGLLSDLSPKTNAVALRALKLWATRDVLPQLVDYARRQEKAGTDKDNLANNQAWIDLLSQFPDESAAQAIALRLKDPALRGRASQALVKLGPAATGAILQYLDHPDADVRKEAQSLARLLDIPEDRQIAQLLTDLADANKLRSRSALQQLARLRPDEANRTRVAAALNAPLLDPDPGIREDALNAVQVWAAPVNAPTLVKFFGNFQPLGWARDPRVVPRVSGALIAIGPSAEDAVIPLLQSPDPLVRYEATRILGQIGTTKSLAPLQAAGQLYSAVDPFFFAQTQNARAAIAARP